MLVAHAWFGHSAGRRAIELETSAALRAAETRQPVSDRCRRLAVEGLVGEHGRHGRAVLCAHATVES